MTQEVQLHLWGRTRRGASAIEFKLHCMVADTLARWCSPGWQYTHIAAGEKRDPATAAKLKRMGVKRGWPDLIFVSARGRICFLELKRRGGKLSPDQAAIATHLMMSGCGYACVDNFQDAVEALQDFGILPLTIHPQ